jgi:hypothetical protein
MNADAAGRDAAGRIGRKRFSTAAARSRKLDEPSGGEATT